ncbi:MAG: ATP-dependent DNA helicase, partial [Leptonema sp. (in: Bacteria)]|nr:ATP-dependent DNA helicase [Leptonema sp. (in: bacteria)]
SIKIFIFNDRVEIINPGKLTNSLTVKKIKNGISIHRNPILNSICKSLLPYSGYGSGIKRVLTINPNIEFINDSEGEQFTVIIPRPGVEGKTI